MKLVWDVKQLYDFADRISEAESFARFARTATTELVKALQEALFENTPVKTGNLCSNWGGAENYSYTIKKQANGYQITLINRAANEQKFMYGYVVNYGGKNEDGSWRKGRFFVETSVAECEEQAEQIIYKELEKWFEKCVRGV